MYMYPLRRRCRVSQNGRIRSFAAAICVSLSACPLHYCSCHRISFLLTRELLMAPMQKTKVSALLFGRASVKVWRRRRVRKTAPHEAGAVAVTQSDAFLPSFSSRPPSCMQIIARIRLCWTDALSRSKGEGWEGATRRTLKSSRLSGTPRRL